MRVPRWLLALLVGISLAASVPAPAHAEPPRTHEILYNRPSGFWTSNAPAVGGAYRYRLLLIGVGISSITAFFVVRMLRRAGRR